MITKQNDIVKFKKKIQPIVICGGEVKGYGVSRKMPKTIFKFFLLVITF